MLSVALATVFLHYRFHLTAISLSILFSRLALFVRSRANRSSPHESFHDTWPIPTGSAAFAGAPSSKRGRPVG